MRHTKIWSSTVFILLFLSLNVIAQKESLPCLNKSFSVVAHIVKNEGDSTGIELDSFVNVWDRVNQLFNPICVSFDVCEIDTIENFRYDTILTHEWDELQVVYHRARRINVFWVGDFEFEDELCGVAALGGIANIENGGLLMKKGDCLNEFAIAHELGRYFGVPYTFGDGEQRTEELVRGENCTETGDLICDTPADPYIIGRPIETYVNETNCRFINMDRDSNSDWYVPHVGNIMSYYPDICKCEFSDEQYRLMVNTYLATDPRMW